MKKNRKKNGPKNQHFVPKCYLSEFVDLNTPTGQEPYIWVFSKNKGRAQKRAPKNVFTENHLYTMEFNGEKDFTIEQDLSKIEGKFVQVMKTIKKREPLSDQEHAYLCIFIAAQLQRTLRFKRNQENFIQQLIDYGTQISLVNGITKSKQVDDWVELKKDIHKLQLIENLPFLTSIIQKMNIAFLCSPDKIKHPFITSDDPCVLFNPDLQWQRFFGPGFGQKNVQLTVPLSPEIMVVFSWANYHGYGLITSNMVEDLNRMTRGHCDKEFVSHSSNKKRIWYRKFPLDPLFVMRILVFKFKIFIHALKTQRLRRFYEK